MTRPRRYAEGTRVPVAKSKAQIEELLRRHGAASFASGWDESAGATLLFRLAGRYVKLTVPPPDPYEFDTDAKRDAEERRCWRARLLIIKAKLELITGGETTVGREFLADIVLPDGTTVGETITPAIESAYESGTMPRALLPGLPTPQSSADDVVDGEIDMNEGA